MSTLTHEELKATEVITYNNNHDPESESFEIQIDFGQISSWDDPYKLFVNGELNASYKTFAGVNKKAKELIKRHDLRKVEA